MAENNGWIKAGYQDFLDYNPATFEIKYGDYRFNGDYFGLKRKKVTIDPKQVNNTAQLRELLGFKNNVSKQTSLFGRLSSYNTQQNGPMASTASLSGGPSLGAGENYYTEQFTEQVLKAIQSGKPASGAIPITQLQRVTGGGANISSVMGKTENVTTGYGSMQQNEDGTYDLFIAPVLDAGEDFTQKVHDATWDIYNRETKGRGKTPKTSLLA